LGVPAHNASIWQAGTAASTAQLAGVAPNAQVN